MGNRQKAKEKGGVQGGATRQLVAEQSSWQSGNCKLCLRSPAVWVGTLLCSFTNISRKLNNREFCRKSCFLFLRNGFNEDCIDHNIVWKKIENTELETFEKNSLQYKQINCPGSNPVYKLHSQICCGKVFFFRIVREPEANCDTKK